MGCCGRTLGWEKSDWEEANSEGAEANKDGAVANSDWDDCWGKREEED